MIVVADTSPLNYLIQIESDFVLPKLYGRIVVPSAVMREMHHVGAPTAVHRWLSAIPAWIVISEPTKLTTVGWISLGPGERDAIQIAEDQHADLLLMDERKGRLEAKRRGLRSTGTLGVLLTAGGRGVVDPRTAYRRLLAETTFRTSLALEAQFLSQLPRH